MPSTNRSTVKQVTEALGVIAPTHYELRDVGRYGPTPIPIHTWHIGVDGDRNIISEGKYALMSCAFDALPYPDDLPRLVAEGRERYAIGK